ncbi:MAG: hypothetical protein ACOCSL_03670 [Thermoplasmatota archaeon]
MNQGQWKIKEKAIIPAGKVHGYRSKYYEDKSWKETIFLAKGDNLYYKNSERKGCIKLKNIYYIDRDINFNKAKQLNVLNFTYSDGDQSKLCIIKSSSKKKIKKRLLKQIILSSQSYFISPYQIGDDINDNLSWNKGDILFSSNDILLTDEGSNVVKKIPREDIMVISQKRIDNQESLRIIHKVEDESHIDVITSTDISLEIIKEYLNEFFLKDQKKTESMDSEGKTIISVLDAAEKGIISPSKKVSNEIGFDPDKLLNVVKTLEDEKVIEAIEKIVEISYTGRFKDDEKSKDEQMKEKPKRKESPEERKQRLETILRRARDKGILKNE